MATISRLKPGQIVYDAHKEQMGNTTMRRMGVWPIRIVDVDPEGRWVLASWNCNPARKYGPTSVARWKVNDPRKKTAPAGGA